MTEAQFRRKVKELMRENNKEIENLIEKALSGALDLRSYEDNYIAPKIFMSAVCSEMAHQWAPYKKNDIKAVRNLELFL